MNKRGRAGIFIAFFIILVVAILVLGHFGAKEAKKENSECTFGFGEKWCWVWATNVYEETGSESLLEGGEQAVG